jgi:predicted double-glycine peptidase
MRNRFEVVDDPELVKIIIVPGDYIPGEDPDTSIYIEPPITPAEQNDLPSLLEVKNQELSQAIGSAITSGGVSRVTMNGETGERQREGGLELAQALLTLRGLRAAVVTTQINGEVNGSIVVLGVFSEQRINFQELPYSCGPTTILNKLRENGDMSETERSLAEFMGAAPEVGCENEDILQAYFDKDLEVVETKYNGSLKDLERCIKAAEAEGLDPYIIVNYFHAFANEGHYGAVTGIDENAVYMKGCSLGWLRLRRQYFEEYWHSSDGTTKGWYAVVR